MGFESIVRKGVAIAQKLTSSLAVPVEHEAWTSHEAGFPSPVYAPGIVYQAIVEEGKRPFRDEGGDTIIADAVLLILEPIVPNGAIGREEPIDPRDRFKMPNGDFGAPIAVPTQNIPLDSGTNRPYAHVVALKAAYGS